MSIVNSQLTPFPLPEDTSAKRFVAELVESGVEPVEAEQAVKLAGAQSQWHYTHLNHLKKAMQESLERIHSEMRDSRVTRQIIEQSLVDVLRAKNIQLPSSLRQQWIAQLMRYANCPDDRQERSLHKAIGDGIILGKHSQTGEDIIFPYSQRPGSVYILGGTQTGKSSILIQIALGDIQRGHSVFFFDPHWSAIEAVLAAMPEDRLKDTIILEFGRDFEPGEPRVHFGLNLLVRTQGSIDLDKSRLMDVFKRLWGHEAGEEASWGPRLENILRNCSLVFLHNPGLTLAEFVEFLRNDLFRERLVANIPDVGEGHFIREFWLKDFAQQYKAEREKWISPVMTRLYSLLTSKEIMYMLAQSDTTLRFREWMDSGKIVLCHISRDTIGDDTRFIGTMIVAELVKAIRSRNPGESYRLCSILIDEFQNFASSEFTHALPETLKFGADFILSTQFYRQLEDEERGAVDQLPHQITLRCSYKDALDRAYLYAQPGMPLYQEQRKLMISPTPVDTIVQHQPHADNFVNEFFKPWREMVKTAKGSIREGEIPGDTSTSVSARGRTVRSYTYTRPTRSWSNRAEVLIAETSLDIMNDFLYHVMVKGNPFCIVPHSLFQTWCYGLNSGQIGDYGIWLTQTIIDHQVRQPTDAQVRAYTALWEAPDEASLSIALRVYEQEARQYFHEELGTAVTDFVNAVRTIAGETYSSPRYILRLLETSRTDCRVDGFIENTWDALSVDAIETTYTCQTIPLLPITPTTQSFPRPLYQWECEGASLKPFLDEAVAFLIPFVLERKIQLEIDRQTRSYQYKIGDVKRDIEKYEYLLAQVDLGYNVWIRGDGIISGIIGYLGDIKRYNERIEGCRSTIAQYQRELSTVASKVEKGRQNWRDMLTNIANTMSRAMQQETWYVYFQDPSYPFSSPEPAIACSPVEVRQAIIDKIITSFSKTLIRNGISSLPYPHEFFISEEDEQHIRRMLEQILQKATLPGHAQYWVVQEKKTDTDWQSSLTLPTGKESTNDTRYTFAFQLQVTPAWLEAVQAKIDLIVTEQKDVFDQSVKYVRQLLAILAREPLKEQSKVFELVETGRVPQSEMVARMVRELVRLPKHTAYASIGTDESDVDDKPRMTTIPFPEGVDKDELKKRLALVRAQTASLATTEEEIVKQLQDRWQQLGMLSAQKDTRKEEETAPTPQEKKAHTKGGSPQPQEITSTPQQTKEKTQTHYTTHRVCAASSALPSQHHPVVFTDEKTTGDTYLTLLYYLSHLTLQQAVRLTGKQSSISNERAKLSKLVKDGLVVSEPMKESVSSGKAPLVYSLTAKGYKHLEAEKGLPPLKRGDYSLHSYQVNELLSTAILAAKHNETVTLVGFEHEKMFRMKPISLPGGKGLEPDGLLMYRIGQDVAPIAFEVDLGIETREQLLDKVQKYLQALQGPYKERFGVDALTIAFVIPNGSENDVARLKGIIEAALETHKEAASLFLVGAYDPVNIAPGDLLSVPFFSQPFDEDEDKHALIEQQTPTPPGTSQDAATTTNEERFGADSVPDVPQLQVTPAPPVPALDKNLKKLIGQFLRHEKRLLYEIAGHYDGTAIDDDDLEKPIQERIEEIKTDPQALKAFIRKNMGGCNKFPNPKDGKDACYLARSTFAVRAAQRVLGEPLLPWPPLMQQLFALVTHPDLQRVLQEDRGLS